MHIYLCCGTCTEDFNEQTVVSGERERLFSIAAIPICHVSLYDFFEVLLFDLFFLFISKGCFSKTDTGQTQYMNPNNNSSLAFIALFRDVWRLFVTQNKFHNMPALLFKDFKSFIAYPVVRCITFMDLLKAIHMQCLICTVGGIWYLII